MANGGAPSQTVERISTVITAVTGSVALIYGLGVATLFWSLYLPYFDRAAPAWHAASLPPRTIAVTYGLRNVFWPVLANAIITVIFVIVFMSVLIPLIDERRERKKRDLPLNWKLWPEWGSVGLAIILLVFWLYISVTLAMVDLFWGASDRGALEWNNRVRTAFLVYEGSLVVGGILGGGLMFSGGMPNDTAPSILQYLRRSRTRAFLVGILIVYLMLFVGAFFLAGGKPTPLPHVVLIQQQTSSDPLSIIELKKAYQRYKESQGTKNKQIVEGEDTQVIEGTLLAHTEKYWHILDEDEDSIMIIPERDGRELALIPASSIPLSCDDLTSRKDAQRILKQDPRDMYDLDQDNDGKACERNSFNKEPMADDDTITITEDDAVDIAVLNGDVDPDGRQTLRMTEVTNPTHGTAEILEGSDTDEIEYIPIPDFHGNDFFTYEVCDNGEPEKCATAKVAVKIDPLNDEPVASDHHYATNEDTEQMVVSEREGVRSNDRDVDKDKVFASVAWEPEHGTLDLDVDGSFTYKPHADFYGEDIIAYKLDDSNGGTDTALAKITVKARNDRPKVDPGGPYYVNEGDSIIVRASGSDIEDEVLTYDWDLDNNGSFETSGRSTRLSAENLSGPGTYNIKARVADSHRDSSVAESSVSVKPWLPRPAPPPPRMC